MGIVHSWVWEEGRPRPSVVYIKFQGAKWQLDGTEEPGIYPVVPKRQEWHLDRRRKVKTLKVRRTQLPLSPAYAMTAHASQGKTLRAVLLDLQVDKRVDPTIGTVATTRVRSREDVLIMRPFPKFLFQRGPSSEGPDLLLKKLRGEAIDHRLGRLPGSQEALCNLRRLPADLPDGHVRAEAMGACESQQAGHVQGLQGGVHPEAPPEAGCREPAEAPLLRLRHQQDRGGLPAGAAGPGECGLLAALPQMRADPAWRDGVRPLHRDQGPARL